MYKITALLQIADLPKSSYYYHVSQFSVPGEYESAKLFIGQIYHEHKGRYGYRRITAELHDRGIHLNHKTVRRLMKALGLVCRVRTKRYNSYKGDIGSIASDRLERDFEAEQPNQKWVTDVTEFHLFGQKLYLSPILGLHSRDIVSYTVSDRPVLSMVADMLLKAFECILNETNLILHSDQASAFFARSRAGNINTGNINTS